MTLDELLTDPARVRDLGPEEIPALLVGLAALQGALAARLTALAASRNGQPEPGADELLTAKEAGRRLGLSADYLYRHAGQLPFTVRPARGAVRFSARGIEDWIRRRQGRPRSS
jgi:predicted DNA-binding transcriptional regulator AlpA